MNRTDDNKRGSERGPSAFQGATAWKPELAGTPIDPAVRAQRAVDLNHAMAMSDLIGMGPGFDAGRCE